MIEFREVILDWRDNFDAWDIYISGQKIGSLRKEYFKKINGTQHGGKYYLNILYRDYILPFSMRDMIPKICKGAIDSMEADLIIAKIEQTDWHKSRVQNCDRYNESLKVVEEKKGYENYKRITRH